MQGKQKYETSQTLCWECANATGGCSWSSEFIPVEGWKAVETKKNTLLSSYVVTECPKFKRDAIRNGLVRYKEGDIIV